MNWPAVLCTFCIKLLANNALVALTLLIAESQPEDKATMVTLVVNLVNQDN
ncbi:hypothetical protein ACFP2F_19275 [Hymenobacter artigasi]|uniref:Uncharacterized protein n=1 Tax=Hymenobacter artigasi TaxID=2719616 RepID=A0ABX1HJP5_9BACT|nr:hypothetical protein [Hymenobacter artigasi]NKI90484.1 hypothetical protein [Hymenobacter artigasi]